MSASKVSQKEGAVSGAVSTRTKPCNSDARCEWSSHSAIQSRGHKRKRIVVPMAARGQTCLFGVSSLVRVST
eukprot:scaffold180217_cov34-Tisochrysis_lutea.AAC.2